MKLHLILFVLCLSAAARAQDNPIGIFDTSADIGKPKKAGSARYDPATQTYTLKGGGYNIWFQRDEFHYLYKKIKGDFILSANFAFIGTGKEPNRKIGWMVRESADADAAHISAVAHGGGLTVLQWRLLKGAYMRDPDDEIFTPKKGYQILQLERIGKRYTLKVAQPGEPLQTIGSKEMETLKDEVLAGLFISAHNEEAVEEARVWNVRISRPVDPSLKPSEQKIQGSRLETMNVFDGKRTVIYQSSARFEAPNWLPDGKTLLFNEGGSLYKIPVQGGTPDKFSTGALDRNNNDHGISFDGKMLAISHHRQGLTGGGSTVYVLPLGGGTPKQVTEATPSYWHGWSPSGKEVLVVGQRGTPIFDIYKVSVDSGKEVNLTSNGPGSHADGPEYSPDGKWIYYNGSSTGTMQLWRMKPDGTGKEQLTFDEYNDWFPHISPDGKWIAFISFMPDIDPSAHPANKQVMLRLMPTAGGAPRVIGYLYGGQGTMNVPSWSPDSRQIAFVSYF
ncbi:SMP-30/gluconolactonase/LRE family protein [Nibrella viscosa]|uniref:SMP-30/gluconolactonase/LRE family protein n=1 Tax=Nibrella viscosa TaxID=1084524 RepID=A0ABP8KGT9_9BACT